MNTLSNPNPYFTYTNQGVDVEQVASLLNEFDTDTDGLSTSEWLNGVRDLKLAGFNDYDPVFKTFVDLFAMNLSFDGDSSRFTLNELYQLSALHDSTDKFGVDRLTIDDFDIAIPTNRNSIIYDEYKFIDPENAFKHGNATSLTEEQKRNLINGFETALRLNEAGVNHYIAPNALPRGTYPNQDLARSVLQMN